MESQKNSINRQDLKKWCKNLLIFVAPTVAIFFGQLALGVEPRLAAGVAVLAFYQAIADLFKKYRAGK